MFTALFINFIFDSIYPFISVNKSPVVASITGDP